MSRHMSAPGVWVEDAPGTARLRYAAYDARPAATVGAMVPVVTLSEIRGKPPVKARETR